MSELLRNINNITAKIKSYALMVKNKLLSAWEKVEIDALKQTLKSVVIKIKKCDFATINLQIKKAYKKAKSLKRKSFRLGKKILRKLSASWRMLLICIPMFLLCYYGLGGFFAERIDVDTEYKLREKRLPMFETAQGMSFLLKREVDDKMWTPNLPPIFPAYILDNMPNFQIGILHAVRDIAIILSKFEQNTDKQKQDIKTAGEFLAYPPNIWLMDKKDGLNLAPSSTAQYRKAAAELQKFAKDGVFYPKSEDLDMLINKIGQSLQKIVVKNEMHQIEHCSDWIDSKADDLFYYAKGYAYAMWQIIKTLGADYHDILLAQNAYTEWTYLLGSLKNAAYYNPLIVRNAEPESLISPNHLMIQNYYLQRALTADGKIKNKLVRIENADKN